MDNLLNALSRALNTFSAENGSDTPDFILAEFLLGVLAAWNKAVKRREEWYGRGPEEVDGPSRIELAGLKSLGPLREEPEPVYHLAMFDDDKSEWPLCNKLMTGHPYTVTHEDAVTCLRCLAIWPLLPLEQPAYLKEDEMPDYVKVELSAQSALGVNKAYRDIWAHKIPNFGWFIVGESVSVTTHLWAEWWWEVPGEPLKFGDAMLKAHIEANSKGQREPEDARVCPCGVKAAEAWAADDTLRGCPKCKRVWPEALIDPTKRRRRDIKYLRELADSCRRVPVLAYEVDGRAADTLQSIAQRLEEELEGGS